MKDLTIKSFLLAGAASLIIASPANAQTNDDDQKTFDDEVIVTGTAVARTAFQTPLSVAKLDSDSLRTFAGSGSQADLLQQIPSLKAEGGGGEVATNLRVRGLPSGGQFEFTPLNYDGATVFSAFGLNSSAFDFFARNDLGIERLEFVKGGVSNLFGVSSTAGILNYISKTGTDEDHGTLQFEVAEDNRYRGDFAFQGPLADNTYYAVSGFYRYDESSLDTGQPTEGFALRGNVKREFADGSGSVRLHGAYINDRVNFYLPIPLDGNSFERVDGNNGQTVFSTNVSRINGTRIGSPEGITEFESDDGFKTIGGSVYAILEKDLGNGWAIDSTIKWSSYDTGSNFFNNGIGPQVPQSQADTVTNLGLDGQGAAVFTDAATGDVLPPDFLIYQGGYNDRERDATDGTFEANISKEITSGAVTHNLTLGTFISRAEAENVQRSIQFLTQFNNDPQLVDLSVGGQTYTLGGVTNPLSAYANQTRSAFKRAIYFADQIEADRWSFDIGGRIETATIENRFELTQTLNTFDFETNAAALAATGTTALPGAPLNTIAFGNGQFREGDATATAWALAVGGLYRLDDNWNLYANASRGYFFPQAQGTGGQINTVGDIAVFDEEPVIQIEGGAKFRFDRFQGSAAVFYTGLRDRNSVVFVGDNLTPQVTATDTDAFGIELEGTYDVSDVLSINGNLTYQDAKFVGDSPAAINGQELNRLPPLLVNIGAVYDDGKFDASAFYNYQSSTFQDGSNNVPLDAYGIARIEAGYTTDLGDGDDSLRFSVGVWNLFDGQGLAEGNPRAGLVQVAPGSASPFFNGRPILPRRVTARVTYDF